MSESVLTVKVLSNAGLGKARHSIMVESYIENPGSIGPGHVLNAILVGGQKLGTHCRVDRAGVTREGEIRCKRVSSQRRFKQLDTSSSQSGWFGRYEWTRSSVVLLIRSQRGAGGGVLGLFVSSAACRHLSAQS